MPQIDTLYDEYVVNIELLRNESIIKTENNDYICPICLREFSKDNINKLSLEDAPQYSLGGRKIAITCKECNNSCGHVIDSHLVRFIERLDEIDFVAGSNRRIAILDNNMKINADLEVGDNKGLKMILPQKINNPKQLQEHINNIKEGDIIDIVNKKKDIDIKKVSTAILKNAYIILFSKFGYDFLLDKHYDRIRQQIINPMRYIVPDLWTRQSINVKDGIHLSNNNQYRGFFIIYSCKYRTTREHRFCVFIPTPLVPYEFAYHFFDKYEPNTPIHMQNIVGDFLTDAEAIKAIHNWVYGWDMKLKY